MSTRILIADRMEMFREALRHLLERESDFAVVGETGDADRLMNLLPHAKPDVLLIDPQLRKRSGIDLLEDIAALEIPVHPVLLAGRMEKSEMIEALLLGACGIVMKHESTQLLFKCIRTVMAGEIWISRHDVVDLVCRLKSVNSGRQPGELDRAHGITPQQHKIIESILAGCSNKEIAQRLFIGERTVKYHLTHIFSKLGVADRRQLAEWTLKNKLRNMQISRAATAPRIHGAPIAQQGNAPRTHGSLRKSAM